MQTQILTRSRELPTLGANAAASPVPNWRTLGDASVPNNVPPDKSSGNARRKIAAAFRNGSRQTGYVGVPLLIGDVVALTLACGSASVAAVLTTSLTPADVAIASLALALPILLGNILAGLYPGVGLNPVVEFRQLARSVTVAVCGAVALSIARKVEFGWTVFFATAWPLLLGLAPIVRSGVRAMYSNRAWWGYPVLVFGNGAATSTVVSNLLKAPEYGLRPIAVLDADAGENSVSHVCGLPVIGKPRLASTLSRRLSIQYAVVVLPDLSRDQATRVLERYAVGIKHVLITSAISPFAPGIPILWRDARDFAGVAGVEVRNRLVDAAPRVVKRATDLFLTIVGGFFLLPLIAVLAGLVKYTSHGPAFYSATRIGERGKRIKVWKFRSMVTNADEVLAEVLAKDPVARAEYEQDHKLKNDPRVTRIGQLLRKTSLDELPQLWNVLRGDMSLVGPRPMLCDEIEKYGRTYAKYKAMRPGITGLWQVSGRNDTTYAQRLHFVEFYVRNWSPWLDLHILARTVATLLFRRGAY